MVVPVSTSRVLKRQLAIGEAFTVLSDKFLGAGIPRYGIRHPFFGLKRVAE